MITVLLAAPVILAGVLAASAVGKLRHGEELSAWQEMDVPAWLQRRWLMRLHPWGELLLAAALLVLGDVLGALVGLVSVALFVGYLVLIVRSRLTDSGASCNCFGARRPVTSLTVVRNAWFLLLAVVSASVTWTTPLLGGSLVALGDTGWWLLAVGASALTVGLSLWHPAEAVADAGIPFVSGNERGDEDLGEYIRQRTPAVPVVLADGRTVNLRQLAARGPILLLAVKEGCGACTSVIAALPRWRPLLPELDIRLLLWPAPERSELTEYDEPQSLHDSHMYVSGSIEDWSTPTAVLLGADGYLAGGPVSGAAAIEEFVGDVYESLHGERPQTD